MNKSEFISEFSKKQKITVKEAKAIIDCVFDSMSDALADGQSVDIRGFGRFSVRTYKAREGRNPATGEKIEIPASRRPHWKPSAIFISEL